MADKLDLLLTKMGELEPKLDGLMDALRTFIQNEVAAQVAAQAATRLEKMNREAVDDGII